MKPIEEGEALFYMDGKQRASLDIDQWKVLFYEAAPVGLNVGDSLLYWLFYNGWSPEQAVEKVLEVLNIPMSYGVKL